MGFEQTDTPQPTTAVEAPRFLGILSLKTSEHKKSNAKSADAAATSPAPQSPWLPALHITESTQAKRRPATKSTINEVELSPANKYEKAVAEQVKQLNSEANFTAYTQSALSRDADRFPPVRNQKDGTTTYTIEQIGLTDRELKPGDASADHFKRLVNITVPDTANSLKDCKFEYKDRQTIDVKEFDALIDHSQKRQSQLSALSLPDAVLPQPNDMSFYTHGIRTGAEEADFMALALQLTNGHSVINVDWNSLAARNEKCSVSEAYSVNRKGAEESYPKFEKELDNAIAHIGAKNTDMIAFSHGAMFDTRYLQHRKETHAAALDEVVFSHPDVPCNVMTPVDAKGKVADADRFYSNVTRKAYVIGSVTDIAMTGAAWNDCKSAPAGASWSDSIALNQREMQIHARIGNGDKNSRSLVTQHGGTYVMEITPQDKKDGYNHFVNMNKISALLNNKDNATKLVNADR